MLRLTTAAIAALALIACATSPSNDINSGKAKLLTETVYVRSSFVGEFLIELSDQDRRNGEILIGDCEKGRGTLKLTAPSAIYIPNLIASGRSNADQLFAAACQRILVLSGQYEKARAQAEASKTPQEREQDRERLRMLIQSQQIQRAQDAADERNNKLIDAIKDSGRRPVQTDCTRDGYGNVKCVTK